MLSLEIEPPLRVGVRDEAALPAEPHKVPCIRQLPTEVKGLDMSATWNVWLSCVEPSSETVSKVFWPRFGMCVQSMV